MYIILCNIRVISLLFIILIPLHADTDCALREPIGERAGEKREDHEGEREQPHDHRLFVGETTTDVLAQIVASEPGRGTIFTIHLPATDAEIEASTATISGVLTGQESILLVDDVLTTGTTLSALVREILENAVAERSLGRRAGYLKGRLKLPSDGPSDSTRASVSSF